MNIRPAVEITQWKHLDWLSNRKPSLAEITFDEFRSLCTAVQFHKIFVSNDKMTINLSKNDCINQEAFKLTVMCIRKNKLPLKAEFVKSKWSTFNPHIEIVYKSKCKKIDVVHAVFNRNKIGSSLKEII